MKPKIVLAHYHLKTGGVTRVLHQQAEALCNDCDLLILTAPPIEITAPAPVVSIDGLAYDAPGVDMPDPRTTAQEIVAAVDSHFGGPCDVFHFHNPTLTKNTHLLEILKSLQHTGYKLFLQIHDFAEDGRPLAYSSEAYPRDCHYGVINSRDYELLLAAGLKPEGTHLLFNPIRPGDVSLEAAETVARVLYPIRAIRRKNIGEAILLSLFFDPDETLAITQPPNSPADFPAYNGWKAFVDHNGLKVEFEAGVGGDFAELLRTSRYVITTSITEGFGFSFLESWLAGKHLWGRKLPDICRDFERHGLRLPHLYTRLAVSLDWFDRARFEACWKACVFRNGELYGYTIRKATVEEAWARVTTQDRIDFGLLNEIFQQQVITRVISDRRARAEMLDLNPLLSTLGSGSFGDDLLEANRRVILENYHPVSYRKRLLDVYAAVCRREIVQSVDKNVLLARFLNLENFSLLKWCDADAC
jgi:hypothetical protein